jgi:hypothetical protein
LEIAVPAIPNFTALYNVPQGKVSENLYHYTWSWNYANHTAYIADINLFGIKTLEVQGKIFGLDNNHRAATPDSFSLYVYSDKYSDGSGAIKVDTLVIKGLDTTSFSKDYSLMHESKASAGDTVFANLVGSRLWLWFASKDSMNDYGTMGDTSWMDTHYGDMWIILNK